MNDNPKPDADLDLRGAAARLRIPAGDIGPVLERAAQRGHRRRRVVATITTLGVVAVTAGGINLAGRGDRSTPLITAGGVIRGESGVTWRRVTPGSALGFASGMTTGTGPLYALSTAPGQIALGRNERPNRVVWRSEDGVEWTAASTLGDDLYLSDLARSDGRVYAIGTGPASASVGGKGIDLLVGWSDDGAKTFQRRRLPVDMAAIAAKSLGSGTTDTEVATGPAGTVAVAKLYAGLNVPALLPTGVTAPNGWVTTATGVDVLGAGTPLACPNPGPNDAPAPTAAQQLGGPGEVPPTWCEGPDARPLVFAAQDGRGVTASYTFAQLGVEGDLLRAVQGQPLAFFAPPGSTDFERVELPGLAQVPGPVVIVAADDGFDLVIAGIGGKPGNLASSETAVLHSADGRSWSPPQLGLSDISWVLAAGRVNGQLTVVGSGDQGGIVARSDGSGGWTSSPLTAVVDADPAAGVFQPLAAGIGPPGVVVAGVTVAHPPPRGPEDPRPTPFRLLVSRDGVSWSDQSLDELAGERVQGVSHLQVTDQRLVVGAQVSQPGRSGPGQRLPSRQITLVGTPA